jgi:hypothetical protein
MRCAYLNEWRLGTRTDIRGGHYRRTGRYQLGSRRCCDPPVFWIAEVRRRTATNDYALIARVWAAANAKARELSWIAQI